MEHRSLYLLLCLIVGITSSLPVPSKREISDPDQYLKKILNSGDKDKAAKPSLHIDDQDELRLRMAVLKAMYEDTKAKLMNTANSFERETRFVSDGGPNVNVGGFDPRGLLEKKEVMKRLTDNAPTLGGKNDPRRPTPSKRTSAISAVAERSRDAGDVDIQTLKTMLKKLDKKMEVFQPESYEKTTPSSLELYVGGADDHLNQEIKELEKLLAKGEGCDPDKNECNNGNPHGAQAKDNESIGNSSGSNLGERLKELSLKMNMSQKTQNSLSSKSDLFTELHDIDDILSKMKVQLAHLR